MIGEHQQSLLEAESSNENILRKKSFYHVPESISLSGVLFPVIKIQ